MKSYTDIEQSKVLAGILPLESADMYWDYDVQKHEDYPMVMDEQFDDTCIRAWSLTALLSALPFHLIVNNQRYAFSMIKGFNKNGETYAIKYYAIFNSSFYYQQYLQNKIIMKESFS